MKPMRLIAVSLAAMLASGGVLAEAKEFGVVDVNQDGFIDAAEFADAGAQSPFDQFDADGDGKVTKKEYEEKLQECE